MNILIDDNVMSVLRERLDGRRLTKHEIIWMLRNAETSVLYDYIEILKKKLKQAFAEIRKEKKVYIRQGFSCCGSCGSYELAEKCKETGKKGYIFNSRQSKDDYSRLGYTYFNFSYGDNDEETVGFMKYVVSVMKKHLINVEWDGNIHTALKVNVK